MPEKKSNRVQLVYNQIVRMILYGDIPYGEKINKNELAEKLNVSMTPVNEAINRLTGTGVIEHQKNYGYFLRKVTWQDIEEAYYTRAAIEGMAVYIYTRDHYNPEDKFLSLFDRFKCGVRPGEAREYLSLDQTFHMEILNKCGNTMLLQIGNNHHHLINSYQHGLTREPNESLSEHRVLLKAIKSGKAEFARNLMTQHHLYAAEYIAKIKHHEVIEKFWGKGIENQFGNLEDY